MSNKSTLLNKVQNLPDSLIPEVEAFVDSLSAELTQNNNDLGNKIDKSFIRNEEEKLKVKAFFQNWKLEIDPIVTIAKTYLTEDYTPPTDGDIEKYMDERLERYR